MSTQLGFDFRDGDGKEFPPQKDGVELMREQVRAAWRSWAVAMGLPLHKEVEVVLRGGRIFRGILKPHDPELFVSEKRDVNQMLEINGVPFEFKEIESCIRLKRG